VATLLLVRHGETDWNVVRRWQGHADRPLTERGREQARQLAAEIENVTAVYSSDLARARETAEIVAADLGLRVTARRDLREIDVGPFEGLTREEVEQRFPDAARLAAERGWGWEGGETPDEMADRVFAALREIAASHAGDRVLVVLHGGNIRAVLAAADGLDLASHRRVVAPAENCHVYSIAVEDGVFRRLD
jgi:broad specificity phosphatase PhoE